MNRREIQQKIKDEMAAELVDNPEFKAGRNQLLALAVLCVVAHAGYRAITVLMYGADYTEALFGLVLTAGIAYIGVTGKTNLMAVYMMLSGVVFAVTQYLGHGMPSDIWSFVSYGCNVVVLVAAILVLVFKGCRYFTKRADDIERKYMNQNL